MRFTKECCAKATGFVFPEGSAVGWKVEVEEAPDGGFNWWIFSTEKERAEAGPSMGFKTAEEAQEEADRCLAGLVGRY